MEGRNNKKYKIDDCYFDTIDSEDKAYFLGLMYADGYNDEKNGKICIDLKDDIGILQKFRNSLQSNHPIRLKIHAKYNTNNYLFRISNKKISKSLSKLGCIQAKSLILTFPSIDIVPEHLQNHFIRGYFDGDGSVGLYFTKQGYKKYKTSITGTLEFLRSIQDVMINKCGLSTTKFDKRYKNDINTYSMQYCGRINYNKFKNYLYKNATIYLQRKYDKFNLD